MFQVTNVQAVSLRLEMRVHFIFMLLLEIGGSVRDCRNIRWVGSSRYAFVYVLEGLF